MPLTEVAGTPHQGSGRARSDKQHIQLRKLASDSRGCRVVMCYPVVWIGVLVEPYIAFVGGTERLDIGEPCSEEPSAIGVWLGDDMYLAPQCLHEESGREVAAAV